MYSKQARLLFINKLLCIEASKSIYFREGMS